MGISITDARALYTNELAAIYADHTSPTGFLRSFFPSVEKGSKIINIEVQRGFEKVAVDVQRGETGNRNEFTKSTEKQFVPPYYNEKFDVTSLDIYDQMFRDGEVSPTVFGRFIETVADKTTALQDKIERAYEVQVSQVFQTGVVSLNKGTNIDFKRKGASLVAYNTAHNWADNSVDPRDILIQGCEFLRQKGKAGGGTFNMIAGSDAMQALINNTLIKESADLKNMDLIMVREPQRNALGATLHGQLTCGSWKVNLWTYPQYYDNAAGVSTPYIDTNKVILIPENPAFQLTFAAVPQLITSVGTQTAGAYKYYEHMDEERSSHEFGVKSAGVAIPVQVDGIFTAQVLAG